MTIYILPFLIAFFFTVFFIAWAISFGRRLKSDVRQSERHIHRRGAVRLGGLAMILAFFLALVLDQHLVITYQLWGVIFATFLIAVFGTWDDLNEMFWKSQLFYQAAIAVLVFIIGVRIYYITNPLTGGILDMTSGIWVFFSVILVLSWIIVVINAMNWLDGIDGLSGGITFIGALTIFFLSLKPEVNQPPLAIVSVALAGTALGFVIFNFNPSRIMAGTAGSMFMGFMLAVLAVFSGTKIATAVLVMAVPLIDFAWVIGERWRRGQSIFKPDRNHLHYKLMELGWSQKKINAFFYSVTIFISIIALNTRAIGKGLTLLATSAIMLAALAAVGRKIENK